MDKLSEQSSRNARQHRCDHLKISVNNRF